MFSETTRRITVTVHPMFLEAQSSPGDQRYFWSYHVTISNNGGEAVRLRRRHWRITDQIGRTQEVEGVGVVGEEPLIPPGDSFEYRSGVPLSTPSGIMVGTYEMEGEDGERFAVAVPAFSLDSPHHAALPN